MTYFELERQILIFKFDYSLLDVSGNSHSHILLIDIQIRIRPLKTHWAIPIIIYNVHNSELF